MFLPVQVHCPQRSIAGQARGSHSNPREESILLSNDLAAAFNVYDQEDNAPVVDCYLSCVHRRLVPHVTQSTTLSEPAPPPGAMGTVPQELHTFSAEEVCLF